MFVIKRYDGAQYFYRFMKLFNTLLECEVKDLAILRLINRGKDLFVDWVGKII